MRRSFRFLWQFVWPNLVALAALAAFVTLGAAASGAPHGNSNFFQTYFNSFPMIMLIILFVLSFSLCTSNLNLAVSFGGRRRDFFWGMQGVMLAYSAAVWLLQRAMARVPALMGWSDPDRWPVVSISKLPVWACFLTLMLMLALGCLCGLLISRHKVLGSIVLVASLLACMAAMVFLMIEAKAEVSLFSVDGRSPSVTLSPWGDLPWILAAALGSGFLICEYFIWRLIRRYCVR